MQAIVDGGCFELATPPPPPPPPPPQLQQPPPQGTSPSTLTPTNPARDAASTGRSRMCSRNRPSLLDSSHWAGRRALSYLRGRSRVRVRSQPHCVVSPDPLYSRKRTLEITNMLFPDPLYSRKRTLEITNMRFRSGPIPTPPLVAHSARHAGIF